MSHPGRRADGRIGWFRALTRYYRDPSASVLGKLVMFLALIYVVMPMDMIPDVPLIGWLDDLGVMGVATAWLMRVVARYRAPEMTAPLTNDGNDEGSAQRLRKPFSVSP